MQQASCASVGAVAKTIIQSVGPRQGRTNRTQPDKSRHHSLKLVVVLTGCVVFCPALSVFTTVGAFCTRMLMREGKHPRSYIRISSVS